MTALGIINIVFGSGCLIIWLFILLMSHAVLSRPDIAGQELLVIMISLGWSLFGVATGVIGLIAGIVMMLQTYSKGRRLLHYVLY